MIENENQDIKRDKNIQWKTVLTIAGMVCLFLVAAAVSLLSRAASAADGGAYSDFKTAAYVIVLTVIAVTMVCLYSKKLQCRIKPEILYVVVGLAFGLVYLLIIPVGVVPDEPVHMYTAYNLSNHIMGIGNGEGGKILTRTDDATFPFQYTELSLEYLKEYYGAFFDKLNDAGIAETGYIPLDAPQYLYILPALGITLGRLLGLGTILTFILGRLFNTMFFVWAVYYSIKKIPFAKCLMFVWALLPMTLQQANSCSYDSGIFAMCAIITALTLRFMYSDEKAKKSEIIIYALAVILLIPCKGHALLPVAAFSLALLVKLARKHRENIKEFTDRHKTVLRWGIVVCVVLLLAFSAVKAVQLVNASLGSGVAYDEQTRYTIGYFIQNPTRLVTIIFQTIVGYGEMYLRQMIGDCMGWLELSISMLVILAYIFLLIAAFLRRDNEEVYIGAGMRTYMWFIFVMVAVLSAAAMLLYWTPFDSYLIEGLQGRYFLPALPIALIACRSRRTCTSPDSDRTIMLLTVYVQVFVLVSYFRNFI